jgi:hypothetical protein
MGAIKGFLKLHGGYKHFFKSLPESIHRFPGGFRKIHVALTALYRKRVSENTRIFWTVF